MKIEKMLATACDNNNQYCPAVFTTDTGDIALIGTVADDALRATIPAGTGIGPDEQLVTVPRSLLVAAGWEPPAVVAVTEKKEPLAV